MSFVVCSVLRFIFSFFLRYSFSLIVLFIMQHRPLETGKTIRSGHTHSVIPELLGL